MNWTIACESGDWFAVQADFSQIPATEENARLMADAPALKAENTRLREALEMQVKHCSNGQIHCTAAPFIRKAEAA